LHSCQHAQSQHHAHNQRPALMLTRQHMVLQAGGKQRVLVGLSTCLTWAATPRDLWQQLERPAQPAETQTPPETPTKHHRSTHSAGSHQPAATTPKPGSKAAAAAAAAAATAAAEAASQPTAVISAAVAHHRRAAASAREAWHAEQAVMRAERPGTLRTFVVCPGIQYGQGKHTLMHGILHCGWASPAAP
jgi:hypothetical protein